MTTDANLVCTDDELNQFLGGELTNLIPLLWGGTAKPARQYGLDVVLDFLSRRSPPIYYSDLQGPAQIKRAVLFGAAEHLFAVNLTTGNQSDLFAYKQQMYAKKFEDELQGLTLIVSGGERVSPGSISVGRR
jgi:hypothetical protein